MRVVARPLVLQPVARLAERGAGRAANAERRLTNRQAGPLKDLRRLEADDRAFEDRVWAIGEVVGPEAGGRVAVVLDRHPDVEARPTHAEVEATDAGEQADRWEVPHAAIISNARSIAYTVSHRAIDCEGFRASSIHELAAH